MASLQDPGDSAYRRSLGGGLVLRWSTAADKAGCMMLSPLALQQQEGQESEFLVRLLEPLVDDTFYKGSSTNWALCVDTSRTQTSVESNNPESYVEKLRRSAESAPERVIAVVYCVPAEFAFEGDAVRVPVSTVQIVACKSTYRLAAGGPNIMDGLFEMVKARARSTRCAFMATSGLPQYYRTKGFEYALSMGRGLITHVSGLPPASPPTHGMQSRYSLRRATASDIPDLERLVLAPRATAEIFHAVGDTATMHAQLAWLLGHRPPVYSSPEYPVDPFFVLEKRDTPEAPPRVVAAAFLRMYEPGSPRVMVNPLLWDGEENASAVAQAIVHELIQAVEALPTPDGSQTKVAAIRWLMPDAHPLRRWFLAHELAVPAPETSRYDHTSTWWIAIDSLPRFLEALVPALNRRLARAKGELGANYTGILHIAAPRTSGGGVVLRVADGLVTVAPAIAGQASKPNVSLPRVPLIQLMMGYVEWQELKALFPDVAIEPAVQPLVEILFPKRHLGSTMNL
ncbi:hypothetical protein B0H11DRAFT_2048605 [Mycena galericulata]|nr:hypothetical protein B0H11DRAFT_2048605 [Mycena galericulata]